MIREDYCSSEVNELLEKKGAFKDVDIRWRFTNCLHRQYVITHQMAMKWLRDVHRKYIDIRYNNQNEKYMFIVFTMVKDKPIDFIYSEYHSTYKEAVDTALKYSLENLI